MRYARDGYSIEAAKRKGRDLPKWYLDEPVIQPYEYSYMSYFYMLGTCRYFEMGPIPYTEILNLAGRRGFDEELTDCLVGVINAMDNAYLGWVDKNRQKNG